MATTLKTGDRGELVKRLQAALISFGFDLGPTGADGGFGNRTRTAVKSFQGERGLPATGVADPDTIAAMDLDPVTLEDLIETDKVITFESNDLDVPPVVQEKIRDCVRLVMDQHDKLLNELQIAVNQFDSTMSFDSEQDANPDVAGVLVSKVFEMAVNEVVSRVPGLTQAKALFDATTAELARASKASESFQVGKWIKNQRAAIAARTKEESTENNRNLLQADMESDYLDQDERGRREFFDQVHEAINSLSGVTGPSLDELEANLYLQWINGHFQRIGEDTPGCIEYRLEYDDDTFDFESCTVKAPFGDKIDSALNDLLDKGHLPGIQRPFDFKVRKRVCLRVDNFVPGGKSWSCGWMDEEGNIIHNPVHPPAQEGLLENAWRLSVDRFKS